LSRKIEGQERKDYGNFNDAEANRSTRETTGLGQVRYCCGTVSKDKKVAPTPGAERWIDVNSNKNDIS
jgi:hypothetical protein